jgi:hypothetical protein
VRSLPKSSVSRQLEDALGCPHPFNLVLILPLTIQIFLVRISVPTWIRLFPHLLASQPIGFLRATSAIRFVFIYLDIAYINEAQIRVDGLDVLSKRLATDIQNTMDRLYAVHTAMINAAGENHPKHVSDLRRVREYHKDNWIQCIAFLRRCYSFCSDVEAVRDAYETESKQNVLAFLKHMHETVQSVHANSKDQCEKSFGFLNSPDGKVIHEGIELVLANPQVPRPLAPWERTTTEEAHCE